MPLTKGKTAFVTGVNGISGHAIVEHLIREPETEWSQIIISSRRPLATHWIDPRVVFVAIDLLDPTENIKQSLSTLVENVTHAFFTSYVHTANFDTLREKNIPLFANFIDALDELCPRLERVCLQTGGKNYGVHLGPVKYPLVEDGPRYTDKNNFYFHQEDYMFDVQKKRKSWDYNIIRPNGIFGFTPHGSGMSEVLSLAIYFLVCRELQEPARFCGNEFLWTNVDNKSSAWGLAHMSVWAVTQVQCKNEAFNYVNGDVFVWKNLWADLAGYFEADAPEPKFMNAAGVSDKLTNEFDILEWSKDKRPVWERVVAKYGGKVEAWDWTSWDSVMWAMGRSWPTIASMSKARRFGWTRYDDSHDNYFQTIRSLENADILPKITKR